MGRDVVPHRTISFKTKYSVAVKFQIVMSLICFHNNPPPYRPSLTHRVCHFHVQNCYYSTMQGRRFRAVVLESGLFLSSRTCLGLVGIWTRTCLGLGHPTRQMFKLVSTESSNTYMLFFLFQNKTINLARLFRKWVM